MLLKPTMEIIRALCTVDSFDRGLQYHKQGRVKGLRLSGGVVSASVLGTQWYKVEINIDHGFKSTCTCPYDLEGYCKHIVAALLALREGYASIIERGRADDEAVAGALEGLDAEKLRDFLRKEFLSDKRLQDHFMIYATGGVKGGGKSVDDYRREVEALYGDASAHEYMEYGDTVEFASFTDLAKRHVEKNNFAEAAKMFQALEEVIAENMDAVDDSNGYIAESFSEALQGLASCADKFDRGTKSAYIDYFFRKFMETDYFKDKYEAALRSVCVNREELEHLGNLLRPHLPESLPDREEDWGRHHESKVLLEMQAFVLDRLIKLGNEGSRGELYRLFKRYYLKDEGFCLSYAQRMEKDGMANEAIKVAEEGLGAFPPHLAIDLRLFLDRHYKTLFPAKHKENLKQLFFQTTDWKYYKNLKNLSGEQWGPVLQDLLEHFSSHSGDGHYDQRTILIDIFIREKMFDAALKEVLASKSLPLLGTYYAHLAERYPTDYFNAYKELLLSYADRSMGRDHYRQVASELRNMKAIKGFEEAFNEYLALLREKYAKRPAFIDEMKQL